MADDHGEGAGTHPEADAVDADPDPVGVRDAGADHADRDAGAEYDADRDAGTEYDAVRDTQPGAVLDPVPLAFAFAFAGAGRGLIAAGPVLLFAR